ncbi:hypothetical protein LTV02_24065 [Nocardia yamanashiensis]|uniref:hypothetical protein n=1 Tax=Nocardia yamanashiensis TaxID=209247 RepID=UPI001E37CD37|nr:hypothetical protein [Nocardia yamanashiensis]UGT39161.1 hypothetical protein LTV02_24065 [Nocardia yamanashiensis]
MRLTHFTLLAAAPLLVAGLTACGQSSDSKDAAKTTTAAATTTTAVPATTTSAVVPPPPTTVTTSPAPITTVTTSPPPTTTSTAPIADADCGPVTDAGGGTRTVIAVGTPAGRVGCTEAINVATKYVQTISDSDVMVVDGWQCNAQPDPAVPSMCAKDGLLINLRAN